ncbi:MAG: L-aspartate oxidase, partial [Phycisphaerae bacterium]
MSTLRAPPGALVDVDLRRLPVQRAAVVVLGGGVAGLRAALEAATFGRVLVVTKDEPLRSASAWAQGGVAAAVDADDTPAEHAADTLAAGGGLSHTEVVDVVVRDAPERIAELVDWGARFDLIAGRLAVGREGGHRANRIVHAGGDATGAEIMRVLMERAAAHENIQLLERCFALDLLLDPAGAVRGVLIVRPDDGFAVVHASATILATGGCACLYPRATPPPIATGDGLAMALRAGAVLRDLEMIQFHPTVLALDKPERRLISEAVRGEGARLLARGGRRFMPEYDPRAELAPRDIVSRAVFREMRRDRAPHVHLDVRHFPPGRFAERFPAIDR